mmetsp:Transcript_21751/g.42785  ORF Transcript_21751/g.42785 Transcript_21751/m.42785 type:complete len:89 (+) Transcript_21751:313-579(+)|eukprot:CAMPEP_0171484578 /NCGR_PEP_ID=MMETSP0958-20121227/79_1 /TAXON_ID=87120 /ORGANISM="Aurantiochytrium limacinum, Strain ATCCMYA-1381" /LENGTH=88 /DNA_ID=CAMNT_0012017295 /DNA_START=284 /DNA_END=550 /DNA_ORIENTATION=+
MAPRALDNDVEVVALDLESRIAAIALQARKRNPEGYKLAPVDDGASSRSSSPPGTPPQVKNFVNTKSGQQFILLDTAKNVPTFLQEIW